LPSPNILVRRAQEGESLITLDGMEHQLSSDVLCITDGDKPIAVAGLMGGADSEVESSTTKVLLEAAHFAPSRVRASGRALGFGTEASRRFERWVDPSNVAKAAARATQLLCELAGAKALEVKDLYAAPLPAEQVEIRLSRTNAILGLKLDLPTISKLLEQLQLKVLLKDNSTLVVETPTWRNDITREIDLIEEVARLHGYDKIPETLPAGSNVAAGRSLVQRLEEKARSLLLRSGLQEVVTYSLENAGKVAKAGLVETGNLAATPLILRNPLSEDYTQLRTSMLPSLLAVLQKNTGNDPKAEAARIFDLARVYLPKNGGLPDERRRIGLALMAAVPVAHWQKELALADFFSLKAIVENLLEGLGAANAEFRAAANSPFHPGRCASIALEGEDIGVMGEVHPSVQEAWDLPQRAYVALLDFDALVRHLKLRPQYQPIPKYPPVDRDLAILINNAIPAAKVNSVIKAAAGNLLERLDVFDLYTGPPVPEGQKSLALSLRFRDPLRTLNDGMVDELIENVVKALKVECDAKLRG
jgi:phenylalanyl-tRNA synthetase beta chain